MTDDERKRTVQGTVDAVVRLVLIITLAVGALAGAFDAGLYVADHYCQKAHECTSGATESCAFGPGIVGLRQCRYEHWARCEPDPSYRVDRTSER